GAVPRALVVGVEDVAFGVEADAAGRADAAGGGDELAIGCDLAAPAAEFAVGRERTRQAERDPEVAFLVEAGAECVLVIVAADCPAVSYDFEGIGAAGPLGILDARHVTALRDVKPTVIVSQPKNFMHAVSEAGELGVLGIVGESVLDDPDFAAARAEGDLVAG